jgi:Holliday junction resolvase RusA-like endonuclease
MMEPIQFFCAGIPKGQPRPKATMRGRHAGVYDPGTANDWKLQVQISGKDHVPAVPLEMPLRVDLTFYFPRPKKHFRTGARASELREDAPRFHTSTPDRDNADKACLDQMTVMRFWRDDAQVCDGRIRKLYEDGRGPGCTITISEAQA